ncbi:hypothetical protein ABVK25_001736 [Lepraria finkii]|uniref:Uncharacterized protein n=1 Tax=Lepraria finkii TaxID=1340010 RepID=A0ABR4BPY9_9LECA
MKATTTKPQNASDDGSNNYQYVYATTDSSVNKLGAWNAFSPQNPIPPTRGSTAALPLRQMIKKTVSRKISESATKVPIPSSQYLNRNVMYWSELHKVFKVTDSNSTGQETRVRATDGFIIWAGPRLDETESAQQAREQEASSGQRTYTMLHSLTTLASTHPKLIIELVFDRVDMLSPRIVAETGLADFPALQRVHFLVLP